MSFFEAHEIVKRYGDYTALDKLSIDVPKGSVFGLLGPNGAGKTTLIRIINQITAPDSGTVTFDGQPLSPAHIARIGYLPEERGLYKKMKVGEQAIYLARLKGLSRQESLKRLKFWFEKFQISEWWGKKVEELSKGMQQKVQFIVTVLHEPDLLIFDEPFSGFDPINANLLKEEILALKAKGATIIFSTHNMASVEEVCDHIALINKSKKVLGGAISDVRAQYSRGIFEVHFEGQPNTEMLQTYLHAPLKTEHGHTQAILSFPEKKTPNQLLSQMMEIGEVSYFSEKMPSMNDIFIQVVNQFSAKNEQNL